MKRQYLFQLFCILSIILYSCKELKSDDAIDQIQKIKKPAVVFSKYDDGIWKSNQMTIKDASGKYIQLNDKSIEQLIKKYNVGDTIQ